MADDIKAEQKLEAEPVLGEKPVESAEAPVEKPEKAVEEKETKIQTEEEKKEALATPPPSKTTQPAPTPAVEKTETLAKIENILQDDMEDLYKSLDPKTQAAFKVKGEETANKIEQILNSVKIKVKKLVELLRDWLKIIPGINKLFLEQEVKIKVDQILALDETKEKEII